MRQRLGFHRFLIRVLCLLLVLQGYPLIALQESGRLEPSEPAWSWLDERTDDALSALERAWRSLEKELTEPASVLPAVHAAQDDGGGSTPPPPPPDLEVPEDAVFGPGAGGPPSPPGFQGPEKLSPSLRGFFAEVGVKAALEAVSFVPGWNLASIPEEPADPDPAQVLAPIAGAYRAVWAYDACDAADPWKLYDPDDAAASDLTAIDHKIGFWIDADSPVDLPSDGTLPASTSFQLCTGWNLIGFPAGQPRHVRNALQTIEGKYLRVFGYDPTDVVDPWEIFDVAVPEWANDLELMVPGRGYWVLVTEAVTLEIANEGVEPTVTIDSPGDLDEVTTLTDVVGTVESPILESWNLRFRAIGEGDWLELASASYPVSGQTLAVFDPTVLLNGLYEIELQATDLLGRQVSESLVVLAQGRQKLGNFTLTFVDLRVPVSGLDLEILRTYDSRDKVERDFGFGWTLDIRQGSYRNNLLPGDGWQIVAGTLPCTSAVETKPHLTTVRLSDAEIYQFALRLADFAPTVGGCFARARFDFADGPFLGAVLEITGNDEVFYENASDRVLDVDTFEIYEPRGVRLTTPDGRVFDLDIEEGVTRLEDLNGNQVNITPEGITHSSGKSIAFERDATGRITRITDPNGNPMSYAYDAAGDLVTFTDREDNVTRFTYDDDHFLLTIEDPRGVQGIRNEYDDDGRLIRHTDAAGKTVEIRHDLAARAEVITDRLGHSQVLEYDERGNVVRETDALGGVTTRTFDGRHRLLSETDALGNTTTYTYDAAGNVTSVRDPLGNTTTFTYNSRLQELTRTSPRGGVTTNVYDSRGNLTSNTDPLGNTTTFTYDAGGNLLTQTDPLGSVKSFGYDADGNMTSEVDALGNETTFGYDANGNVLSETLRRVTDAGTETLVTTFTYDKLGRGTQTVYPDGSTATAVYDPVGKVIETTNQLGERVALAYDAMSRLTGATYPDGATESFIYDAAGRVVAETDRAGNTTAFVYDALGRLVENRFADATSARSLYDAAGRLVGTVDARGNTTTFEHDAAGRRIRVIDALGNATTFGFDADGNRTSITDARGNTTTFEHDLAGRETRIAFSDGSERSVTYDGRGRVTAETDQAAQTTQFGYDARGDLVSVTDALGQVARYGYDELGNRLSQTDANGHVTLFSYDRLGRRIRRTLPGGASETLAYDAAGNVTSRTDPNGATATFTYDENNRLIQAAYAGGETVAYAYTPMGYRSSVTDSRGTTTYTYDPRHRLTELTYPDNRKLTYAYDAAGNRTGLTAHLGAITLTTTYTYDAANRLVSVGDPQGRLYGLGYDAAGNRASLSHPNGVDTTYAYDALNRLTGITTRSSAGDMLQSFAYTLGPAGNRLRVEENDGTRRDYEYDPLYRLQRETVSDAAGTTVFDNAFTYDLVGNRLSRTRTDGGGTSTVSYSYDARDRLLAEAGTDYSWDPNGNLIGKSGIATFDWTSNDRLRTVTLDDGTVLNHLYDVDGSRVRTEVTPPGEATRVVDYLVDPYDRSGVLSQVVAETDGAGNLLAHYVRGDDLLAVVRLSGTRFYHADGLGSVRMLTDDGGAVTDRYTFTAFGELLEHAGEDTNAFLFAGEPLDANSGFYYNRARWMDPTTGRFASADPFPGFNQDPLSLHKYLYASVNPVNMVDPTGLFTVGELVIVSAIVGFLSGAVIGYIEGGVWGAVGGALAGLILSPIMTLVMVGAGYGIAFAAGIAPAAGLAISGAIFTIIGGLMAVKEYIEAETPRQKWAAAIGLVILAVSLGTTAVKAPRRVTLLGSVDDVRPFKKVPGWDVLVDNPRWSPELNRQWLQTGAVDQRNAVFLATNPTKFAQYRQSIGQPISIFLHLELPLLRGQGFWQVWRFMISTGF